LDTETRGIIEHQINTVYQNQNTLEGLDWILEIDKDLESFYDFALGYVLGSLMQIVVNHAVTLKEAKKTKVLFEKLEKERKENPNRKFRRVIAELSEEETEEIRDIIKRWVIPFREKLNREIDIRKAKTKT
jgi:hypothetical protein